jgi:hypothetical protein
MPLLLDTQILIWWLLGDDRLRATTQELIATNPCHVSVASVWEVAIKHRLGKLPLDPIRFRNGCLEAGAALLMIRDSHVIETAALPAIHEDPFDRLLIAQARCERLMAVSSDRLWSQYDLRLHRA